MTSFGGGCALLELPSGKARCWAKAINAHSIEAVSEGLIAVASSVGNRGDKVPLVDEKVSIDPLVELLLPSAHGMVWYDARN